MRTKFTLAILATIVAMITAQQRSRRPTTSFKKKSEGLELPNNATAIRENIVDTFSCENRIYGYYADIDNDCQIFHVCLPHTRNIVRFSFICPAETVFNQATFVCTRTEGSIPCEDSEKYYKLNEQFGKVEESTEENATDSPGGEIEATTEAANPSPRPTRPSASPQRPTITTAPELQTTQYTQRPPKPTQGKKRRQ